MSTATLRELALLLAGLAITATALRSKPPDPALLATGIGLLAGTGVVAGKSKGRNGSDG